LTIVIVVTTVMVHHSYDMVR